jgi:hypothetical protein
MPNDKSADMRSEWAEQLPAFAPDAQIYEGQESRDALAGLLDDEPAADEQEVTRRLRGRPSLNGAAGRGVHAKQLHVRISEDYFDLLQKHVSQSHLKGGSELVRLALAEYFDNHKISA